MNFYFLHSFMVLLLFFLKFSDSGIDIENNLMAKGYPLEALFRRRRMRGHSLKHRPYLKGHRDTYKQTVEEIGLKSSFEIEKEKALQDIKMGIFKYALPSSASPDGYGKSKEDAGRFVAQVEVETVTSPSGTRTKLHLVPKKKPKNQHPISPSGDDPKTSTEDKTKERSSDAASYGMDRLERSPTDVTEVGPTQGVETGPMFPYRRRRRGRRRHFRGRRRKIKEDGGGPEGGGPTLSGDAHRKRDVETGESNPRLNVSQEAVKDLLKKLQDAEGELKSEELEVVKLEKQMNEAQQAVHESAMRVKSFGLQMEKADESMHAASANAAEAKQQLSLHDWKLYEAKGKIHQLSSELVEVEEDIAQSLNNLTHQKDTATPHPTDSTTPPTVAQHIETSTAATTSVSHTCTCTTSTSTTTSTTTSATTSTTTSSTASPSTTSSGFAIKPRASEECHCHHGN